MNDFDAAAFQEGNSNRSTIAPTQTLTLTQKLTLTIALTLTLTLTLTLSRISIRVWRSEYFLKQ